MPLETHQKVHYELPVKTLSLVFLIGLGLRLFFITRAPGIHFDEAWAANYAARIAAEPRFWPLDAMSPYTHPWSHYITALFFKVLGTHLWVSRLAGISMSGVGIIFISRALFVLGERRASIYFACLAAACVPSILNERFSIEINTFHVLCLGLFVYGITVRRLFLVALAAIFGATSHVLFLAPLLAAYWVWASCRSGDCARERAWIAGICLLLLPFFWSIYTGIPEKGKALTLIGIDAGILLHVLFPFSLRPPTLAQNLTQTLAQTLERKLRWLLLPLVGIFLVILTAMMEGDLSIAFTHGMISSVGVSVLCIVMAVLGSGYLLNCAWRQIYHGEWPKHFARWAFYLVFFVGVMSTKPAPRYFEMVFLVALVGAALTLARRPSRSALVFILVFMLTGVLQWNQNYIMPALHHEGIDQSFRYLLFHDNSSDSLSKQNLVSELASEGCSPEQVTTTDPRLGEALHFLAIGDWQADPEKKCPARKIRVERAAASLIPGRRFEEFTLQPLQE